MNNNLFGAAERLELIKEMYEVYGNSIKQLNEKEQYEVIKKVRQITTMPSAWIRTNISKLKKND